MAVRAEIPNSNIFLRDGEHPRVKWYAQVTKECSFREKLHASQAMVVLTQDSICLNIVDRIG